LARARAVADSHDPILNAELLKAVQDVATDAGLLLIQAQHIALAQVGEAINIRLKGFEGK
jgi:hypothetical protein